MNPRAHQLAVALEQGAAALAAFASSLTESQWQSRLPKDGRRIGVVVHHVASMYPLEVELSQKLADGGALTALTWNAVHEINANHAHAFDSVTKEEALELLRRNAAAAAVAIREMGDAQLDQVAPNSLYGDCPLTCQFFVEDHPVRHSFHHLARLRAAVGASETGPVRRQGADPHARR